MRHIASGRVIALAAAAALGVGGCGPDAADLVEPATATFVVDPELEGGCAWIEAEDGTRYEVVWPEGFEVDLEQRTLVAPDGHLAAEHGDTIEVGGRVDTDVNTLCQVGPVLRAETVVTDPERVTAG